MMKLIDILVRDLPKHGGWPDRFSGLVQLENGVVINDYEASNPFRAEAICYGRKFEIASDGATAVSRGQYEAALAASKLEWDGSGIPPVGCECERSWCGDRWINCTVIFASDETIVVKLATQEAAYGIREVKFRPIISEMGRKRGSAVREMLKLTYGPTEYNYREICEILYDGIAAGKITGVKLED